MTKKTVGMGEDRRAVLLDEPKQESISLLRYTAAVHADGRVKDRGVRGQRGDTLHHVVGRQVGEPFERHTAGRALKRALEQVIPELLRRGGAGHRHDDMVGVGK